MISAKRSESKARDMYYVCVIVLIVIILIWNTTDTAVSKLDHRSYKIVRQNNLDNPEYAALMLSKINKTILQLIEHLRNKYIWNAGGLDNAHTTGADMKQTPFADFSFLGMTGSWFDQNADPEVTQFGIKQFVIRLMNKYNPDSLRENKPISTSQTSFVNGKGRDVAFCLRKNINGDYHRDFGLIQFVALHELTHIGTSGYGHGDEFWNYFKFVITEAKEAGIHIPVDYSKNPTNYCGLNIDYNPYFD